MFRSALTLLSAVNTLKSTSAQNCSDTWTQVGGTQIFCVPQSEQFVKPLYEVQFTTNNTNHPVAAIYLYLEYNVFGYGQLPCPEKMVNITGPNWASLTCAGYNMTAENFTQIANNYTLPFDYFSITGNLATQEEPGCPELAVIESGSIYGDNNAFELWNIPECPENSMDKQKTLKGEEAPAPM